MRFFRRTTAIFALLIALPALAAIDPDKPTVMVTGANRGIGFEFVRELADRDWNVIATVRNPENATQLSELAHTHPHVIVETLDVTHLDAIAALAAKYKHQPIDVLILNAAITPAFPAAFKPAAGVDYDNALESFQVNAIAPLKMAVSFLGSVAASKQKKIVVLSSKGGSFEEGPKMPIMYNYRASKSALNMYMHTLSFETPKQGVILTLISPGSVNTVVSMKQPGSIEAPESVSKMLQVIDTLTAQDNGKFLNYADRRVIPW